MELKNALKTALEFERKGQNIYDEASKKSENLIAKKTFEYLAKQELNHIREIEAFIKKDSPDIKLEGDTPEETEKFFKTTVKEFKDKTFMSHDDKMIYHTAMDLEESAFEFYEEQMKKAKDQKTKRFFEFLLAQENAHFAFLSKSLDFIKHPENFFKNEENWNFEGA